MSMTTPDRDPGLDTLLDLHGQILFVDEAGHWVKFIVLQTEVTRGTAARVELLPDTARARWYEAGGIR